MVASHKSLEVLDVSQSVKPPPERPSVASDERVTWPPKTAVFKFVVAAPPIFRVVTFVLNRVAVV